MSMTQVDILKQIYELIDLYKSYDDTSKYKIFKKHKIKKCIVKMENDIIINNNTFDLLDSLLSFIKCMNIDTNQLDNISITYNKDITNNKYIGIKLLSEYSNINIYYFPNKSFYIYDDEYSYNIYKNTKIPNIILNRWLPILDEIDKVIIHTIYTIYLLQKQNTSKA